MALTDAYEERRRQSLHELGIAVNLAFHAPKNLQKAFGPKPRRVDLEGKWW